MPAIRADRATAGPPSAESDAPPRRAPRIHRARADLADILESLTDAVWAADRRWRFTHVNRRAEALWGRRRDDLLGRVVWDVFPETLDWDARTMLERVMHGGTAAHFETVSPVLHRWVHVHASPTHAGIAVHFEEIDDRKREEIARRLLADAGSVLAASLDLEATLANVARLAVPGFADWCLVHLLEPDGTLRLVEAVHGDPGRAAIARAIQQRYPSSAGDAAGLAAVIRAGHGVVSPEIPGAALERLAHGPEHLAMLRSLGLRSAIAVPLAARGSVLGAMTLMHAESDRRYDDADLAAAEELARRAALAVDNARLYREARHALREAEHANRAKADFLAVMSHELRTPLTAVIGYTELLVDEIVGPLNDTQRDQLGRVRASSEHLLALIDDVLRFARIDVGKEEVHLAPCSLAGVIDEAATVVRPLLDRKGLPLRRELPASDVTIITDHAKLRQILVNLLANAGKFTDRGEVVMRVRLTSDRDGSAVLEIAVSDTGVGIRAEHLPHVFDAFWQADQRPTRAIGGTGLGLSIARQLAQLLGGDIAVESEPGRGSTFTVKLEVGGEG